MSGRHRSYAAQQQQNTRSTFPTGLIAAGAAIVVAGGVVFFAVHDKNPAHATGQPSSPGSAACANPVTLTVAASPDIAPVLTQIAAQNTCTHITVNSAEAADVAGYLDGTAKGSNITAQPDVWIPDTSLWLDVAHSTPAGKNTVAAAGTPIATTPLVLGMPQPLAQSLGWPAKSIGWADLLTNQQSTAPWDLAVPDPTASGPGLAAITTIQGLTIQAAGADPTAKQTAELKLTAIFKGMSNHVQGSLTTLLTSLPSAEATSATSGGIAAFPATEQKIAAYNTARPAVPLAAIYPTEGTVMFDYPYVESTRLDPEHTQAANAFLAALQTPTAITDLQAIGFRDAKGTAGPTLTTANGVNPALPPLLPADTTHTAAPTALHTWGTISEQTRGLLVLDVSGSMGLTVPGQFDQNGKPLTRLQMTEAACLGGMPLFGDTSELGLWTFTTKPQGGATVHTELVPMGPLGGAVNGTPRRTVLAAAFQNLTVQGGSRNGLYDTVLDAYTTVQTGWAANKSNAVVIFTDGKDDGLNSMSSSQLIAKLQALKAADPTHPVRVLVIALGKGVDLTVLKKVTAATDGQAIYAATAQQIGAAALEGFAGRLQ